MLSRHSAAVEKGALFGQNKACALSFGQEFNREESREDDLCTIVHCPGTDDPPVPDDILVVRVG